MTPMEHQQRIADSEREIERLAAQYASDQDPAMLNALQRARKRLENQKGHVRGKEKRKAKKQERLAKMSPEQLAEHKFNQSLYDAKYRERGKNRIKEFNEKLLEAEVDAGETEAQLVQEDYNQQVRAIENARDEAISKLELEQPKNWEDKICNLRCKVTVQITQLTADLEGRKERARHRAAKEIRASFDPSSYRLNKNRQNARYYERNREEIIARVRYNQQYEDLPGGGGVQIISAKEDERRKLIQKYEALGLEIDLTTMQWVNGEWRFQYKKVRDIKNTTYRGERKPQRLRPIVPELSPEKLKYKLDLAAQIERERETRRANQATPRNVTREIKRFLAMSDEERRAAGNELLKSMGIAPETIYPQGEAAQDAGSAA